MTPRHRALLDAILHSPMHIIVTLRSKTETAQTEGPNGKKQVVKLGMKAEQRDGFEYEMTVVLDLIHDGHFATATKDRTGLFTSSSPAPICAETGTQLKAWLETGAEPPKEVTVADWCARMDAAKSSRELAAIATEAWEATGDQKIIDHHEAVKAARLAARSQQLAEQA